MIADKLLCQECDLLYSSKSKLNRHIREKHSDKAPSISCKVCGQNFKRKYHHNRHFRSVHEKKYFQCQLCVSQFVEKYKLKNHYKKIHLLKYCSVCETKIPPQDASHTCQPKKYSCGIDNCNRIYKKVDFFQKHQKSHRKEKKQDLEGSQKENSRDSHRNNNLDESNLKEYSSEKLTGNLNSFTPKDIINHNSKQSLEANQIPTDSQTNNSFRNKDTDLELIVSKINSHPKILHNQNTKLKLKVKSIFQKDFFSKSISLKLKSDKLIKRIKKKNNKLQFLCSFEGCLKTFKFYANLLRHLKSHDKNKIKNNGKDLLM